MRLIKENTFAFESFYDSLREKRQIENKKNGSLNFDYENENPNTLLQKYAHFIQNISLLENKINNADSSDSIISIFNAAIKRILTSKKADFFFFDKTNQTFYPAVKTNDAAAGFINHINKEGILDWVYENREPTIIPDTKTYSIKGSQLNYLVFPIIQNNKNKGLLSIITPISSVSSFSIEVHMVKIAIGIAFPRIQLLRKQERMNRVYKELQTYQSKLKQDYKLSAIGELTEGIVENLLTPMQIILSNTEMLEEKYGETDKENFVSIKKQIKSIDAMVTRLVKFSSRNRTKESTQSCDLNKIISDYFQLIESFFKNKNYECIVDLEENLPTILSHPDHIKQLLTHVFSIIRANMNDDGGLLVQTKQSQEKVIIRIITTDYIAGLAGSNLAESSDASIKLIKNLMKKHEGNITCKAQPSSGSHIVLEFPLRRKLR
ncbi:MAG: HAMP domain-containing histidine kinase [Ignavibacteriae bacterium]|nr:sensor histidine kinase [Ignavibacteriota bacterium]NOG97160.1 HAMP domain-containing histidine kinase [Ignavibacteriota bacterium]